MSEIETPPAPKPTLRERLHNMRPSVVTAGAPVFPLVVLFGLNAVDEFDREAYSVLLPNIRDHFGLSIGGILGLVSAVSFFVLILEIPLAHYSDRGRRTRIAAGGAAMWGGFSFFTALAPTVPLFGVARGGASLGRAVNGATHRALLSDYYAVEARPAVFAFHSAANSVGQFIAPLLAGFLAYYFGWRAPFLLFAIPTFIFVALALRLQEPVRGNHERRMMGASETTIETEEAPATFAEACRTLWQVRAIRRVWLATPVIGIPQFALRPLLQLFQADVLGLNEAERGIIAAINEPFQFVGLFIGIPIATRMLKKDPALLVRFVCVVMSMQVVSMFLLVFTRNVALYVAFGCLMATVSSISGPGVAVLTSLIIPPRIRSVGFTIGSVFAIPVLIVGPVVGVLADAWGLQLAIMLLCPVILSGVYMINTAGSFVASDINKIRTATVAMAEVRAARLAGQKKLLIVKDLDFAYGGVQVLFQVNLEVEDGEMVALLGTNGAGKSTLLKCISGLVVTDGGAIIYDGRDITNCGPNETAQYGIAQVPGGRGVFPSLTVAENLKAAGWMYRRDRDYLKESTERVLEHFPVLRDRWNQPAGNLSGGEQQMLSLAQAFIARPKLLMIDELSLGLAPTIVERLVEIVRAINANGTTVIIVEQSVHTALQLAHRAVFMEKGEIRYSGPTADLLGRDDILRSVFLEGAMSQLGTETPSPAGGNGKGNGKAKAMSVKADLARREAILAEPVVLEAFDLSKRFGGVVAVNGVSLELHKGQVLGLIGANGAGKTTLFDLLTGFLPLDTGRVVLDGHDITELPAHERALRGLGRSFQDAKLWPSLTVSESVAVALERRVEVGNPIHAFLDLPNVRSSEAKVAARVEELIELLGLTAFRDKFISELSTGSRRIVEIATLLANEPKILLLDEPSSGIAQRETEALGPLLKDVQAYMDCSILVIEHDMPLITKLADHIVALELGAVITHGIPQDVLSHPRVVESYLGGSSSVDLTKPTPRRRTRRAVTAG